MVVFQGIYECIRQTINNPSLHPNKTNTPPPHVDVAVSVGVVFLCVVVCIGIAGLWSVLIVMSNAAVSKNSMVGIVIATFLITEVVILSLAQGIVCNRKTK